MAMDPPDPNNYEICFIIDFSVKSEFKLTKWIHLICQVLSSASSSIDDSKDEEMKLASKGKKR